MRIAYLHYLCAQATALVGIAAGTRPWAARDVGDRIRQALSHYDVVSPAVEGVVQAASRTARLVPRGNPTVTRAFRGTRHA
jgi:hypothetical protein